MANNDSNNSSLRRNLRLNHLPADYPLRTEPLSETPDFLDQLATLATSVPRFISLDGGTWSTRALQGVGFPPPAIGDIPVGGTGSEEEMLQAMARSTIPDQPERQNTKLPVTTVVSALPKTTYKEQNDPKDSDRSLAYVKVQRTLLKYLATQASDTLTPLQARRWTQAIEPSTKKPKADEAVRLCYYMRSQGFDTYAKIEKGMMSLFVVNPRTNIRDWKSDHLYWKQHVTTNEIHYTAPSGGGTMRSGATRRNALVASAVPPPARVGQFTIESLLAELRGGEAGPAEARENREQGVADGGIAEPNAAGAQQPVAADPQAQQRADISALVAAAEVALNRLLTSDLQDPAAIEAAFMQIEELQQQLHRG